MTKKKKTSNRHRRRLGFVQGFLTVVFTAFLLALGLTVFFRVSDIRVEGNNRYSTAKVSEASGIVQGENLILINKNQAANLIMGNLPYVSEVKIIRQLPDTVIIYITESGAAATVTDQLGDLWDIDVSGKALQKSEGQSSAIRVEGFTPMAAVKGESLIPTDGDETKGEKLTAILSSLSRNGLLSHVSVLDLSDASCPELTYDQIYTVKLGNVENIDYKLQYLEAILKEPGTEAAGVIDLTFQQDEYAHYRPLA